MTNQIAEFFKRDGAIGLILAIGPENARFKKIASQVAVSHDTVSNRVEEARNMGLIKAEAVSDIGTSFTNKLTPAGEICYWGMVELGLDDVYTEYVNAIENYNNLSDKYARQVGDEAEWLDWVLESDVRVDNLLTKFEARGEDMIPPFSSYPEPVKQALQQQSVEPLENIDHKDVWLWRIIHYPPEPGQEDHPTPPYNNDT
jgi:DNA-binding HxlR family transcriptional regulator